MLSASIIDIKSRRRIAVRQFMSVPDVGDIIGLPDSKPPIFVGGLPFTSAPDVPYTVLATRSECADGVECAVLVKLSAPQCRLELSW